MALKRPEVAHDDMHDECMTVYPVALEILVSSSFVACQVAWGGGIVLNALQAENGR